jgi:hypothetical protein
MQQNSKTNIHQSKNCICSNLTYANYSYYEYSGEILHFMLVMSRDFAEYVTLTYLPATLLSARKQIAVSVDIPIHPLLPVMPCKCHVN